MFHNIQEQVKWWLFPIDTDEDKISLAKFFVEERDIVEEYFSDKPLPFGQGPHAPRFWPTSHQILFANWVIEYKFSLFCRADMRVFVIELVSPTRRSARIAASHGFCHEDMRDFTIELISPRRSARIAAAHAGLRCI